MQGRRAGQLAGHLFKNTVKRRLFKLFSAQLFALFPHLPPGLKKNCIKNSPASLKNRAPDQQITAAPVMFAPAGSSFRGSATFPMPGARV